MPALCGACRRTGTPKLGASPSRTLRGMTVSKTSSGKCSRTSRSTSRASRVRPSCIVRIIPATVSRGLSSRWISDERVEQLRQALEGEVLGLHRHDHAVGRDERVDRERAERGRAVEEREQVALAHAAERVAQARLRARRSAAARRWRPRVRAWTAPRRAARRRWAGGRVQRELARRGSRRRWGEPSFGRPSATVALHCGSRSTSSVGIAGVGHARAEVHGGGGLARRRPSGWRSRRRCPFGLKLGGGPVGSGASRTVANSSPRVVREARATFQPIAARIGPSEPATQPSGRLRAIPGRRGKPSGVGATFRNTCRWRFSAPSNGTTRRTSLSSSPSAGRRARRRPRPRHPGRPSRPPARPPRAAAAPRTRPAPRAGHRAGGDHVVGARPPPAPAGPPPTPRPAP